MTYTAYELKHFRGYNIENETRCPYCFKVLDLDEEGEEEFYLLDNELLHPDCLVDMIAERGAEYISQKQRREYFEWYFDVMFRGSVYTPDEVMEVILNDTQAVIDFIEDDPDYFIRWWLNE